MATFSVNQNRQFYVLKSAIANSGEPSALGSAVVKADKQGNVFLKYMGAGGLMRTDLIDPSTVTHCTKTKFEGYSLTMKEIKVNDAAAPGGKMLTGQDYILRLFVRKYIGDSDIYSTVKYGAVHANANMTTSQFYVKMAESLIGNMKREPVQLFNVFLLVSGAGTTAKPRRLIAPVNGKFTLENDSVNTDTAEAIVVQEAIQPWTLGKKKAARVEFEVQTAEVTTNADTFLWGEDSIKDVTDNADYNGYFAANGAGNKLNSNVYPLKTIAGQYIADMEWFFMGERGDIYRQAGWPKNIDTTYLADPTARSYNVLDIHYSFNGSGVDSYKSEKTLTLVTTEADSAFANLLAKIPLKG